MEYINELSKRSKLPEGFRAAKITFPFYPAEKELKYPFLMSLSLVLLDDATDSFAGVFTGNKCPGVPVIMGRERLGCDKTLGVLINNKIANVRTTGGRENAEKVLNCLAGAAGADSEQLFFASTGVIGWELPVTQMCENIPPLIAGLSRDSILEVARGIMTTDSYPKIRAAAVGEGLVTGIAKGAGMIEPNMSTLLGFIFTDVDIPRTILQEYLGRAVARSFNCISIDGDQSTSDMILCFSSRRKKGVDEAVFYESLERVCRELAEDVVRNGEGTAHVIRVRIKDIDNERNARLLGKGIINSPLIKTAIFGNDPNIGRIIMALGDHAGNNDIALDPEKISISIGSTVVYANGVFIIDAGSEKTIAGYLEASSLNPDKHYPKHDRTVDIDITIGTGDACCEVFGSDLSYEYVRENADYRT